MSGRRGLVDLEFDLIELQKRVRTLEDQQQKNHIYEVGIVPDSTTTWPGYTTTGAGYLIVPLDLGGDFVVHRAQTHMEMGSGTGVVGCALYKGSTSFFKHWTETGTLAQDKINHQIQFIQKAVGGQTLNTTGSIPRFEFQTPAFLPYSDQALYCLVFSHVAASVIFHGAHGSSTLTPRRAMHKVAAVSNSGSFPATIDVPSTAVIYPYVQLQSVVGSRMSGGL